MSELEKMESQHLISQEEWSCTLVLLYWLRVAGALFQNRYLSLFVFYSITFLLFPFPFYSFIHLYLINFCVQAMKKFNLTSEDPQTYGIGLKEVWQVAPEKHKSGTIIHTIGWPIWNQYLLLLSFFFLFSFSLFSLFLSFVLFIFDWL